MTYKKVNAGTWLHRLYDASTEPDSLLGRKQPLDLLEDGGNVGRLANGAADELLILDGDVADPHRGWRQVEHLERCQRTFVGRKEQIAGFYLDVASGACLLSQPLFGNFGDPG